MSHWNFRQNKPETSIQAYPESLYHFSDYTTINTHSIVLYANRFYPILLYANRLFPIILFANRFFFYSSMQTTRYFSYPKVKVWWTTTTITLLGPQCFATRGQKWLEYFCKLNVEDTLGKFCQNSCVKYSGNVYPWRGGVPFWAAL
mgnify:CR=1 FL=1